MKRLALALSCAVFVSSMGWVGSRNAIVHGQAAKTSSLEVVLARFRNIPAFSARFHEEKHMTLLAAPLESDGELHYRRPGKLVRRTSAPEKTLLVVDGGTLRVQDAAGARTLTDKTHPAVGAIMGTFLKVLAGDLSGLRKDATLEESAATDGAFKVKVVSKDAALRRIIRELTFEGRGETLTRMTMIDGNGDTTITTFRDVRVRKEIPAAEWARLIRFGG